MMNDLYQPAIPECFDFFYFDKLKCKKNCFHILLIGLKCVKSLFITGTRQNLIYLLAKHYSRPGVLSGN